MRKHLEDQTTQYIYIYEDKLVQDALRRILEAVSGGCEPLDICGEAAIDLGRERGIWGERPLPPVKELHFQDTSVS